jgi:hypothetical protein
VQWIELVKENHQTFAMHRIYFYFRACTRLINQYNFISHTSLGFLSPTLVTHGIKLEQILWSIFAVISWQRQVSSNPKEKKEAFNKSLLKQFYSIYTHVFSNQAK